MNRCVTAGSHPVQQLERSRPHHNGFRLVRPLRVLVYNPNGKPISRQLRLHRQSNWACPGNQYIRFHPVSFFLWTVSGLMLRPANEIAVSHLPEAEYSTNPPDILRHKSCGITHMAGNMQEL
jgi:hypothetical protein